MRDFVSLRGSVVNCAGGVSLGRRGWITGEEIVQGPDTTPATAERHGYQFFVPVDAESAVTPEPLVAMGRFFHEAAAVDPRTGVVYQTEDAGSGVGSGFYRFLPVDPHDLSREGGCRYSRSGGGRRPTCARGSARTRDCPWSG